MNLAKIEKLLVTSSFRAIFFKILEAPLIFHGLRIPQSTLCLEIGAGKGFASKIILKRYSPKKVFVTDSDPEMLEQAKKFVGKNKKVVYKVEDASKLSFKKDYFDYVFALGVLHHIRDYKKAIKEIFRILKPGGVFVMQDYLSGIYMFPHHRISCYRKIFPHERLLSKNELMKTLKKNGFMVKVKFSFFSYYIILTAMKPKPRT